MDKERNNRFRHDFKTFLNHIVGYGEILKEDARELDLVELSEIFGIIRETALTLRNTSDVFFKTATLEDPPDPLSFRRTVFSLITQIKTNIAVAREKLVADSPNQFKIDIEQMNSSANMIINLFDEKRPDGFRDSVIRIIPDKPETSRFEDNKSKFPGRILIVDDDKVNRDLMARFINRQGHTVCTSENGKDALLMMTKVHFDLVILDVMMPTIDGYMVLNIIKDDPHLQDTPVIVISALEDSRAMARCIELGAEDYLPREFDPVILKARIDASLEKRRIKLQREIAIQEILNSQKKLRNELKEAADYVHSMLPAPLENNFIEADWEFIPSLSLGGDIFDYYQLDGNTFAFYLVDVSGHGIEAALVSVSIMNMLKTETLSDADFRDPASVLASLNSSFRIEEQNNLYFTIWYGVYDIPTRLLRFSSGGSTPALLFNRDGTSRHLSSGGMIIGVDPGAIFRTDTIVVPPGATICLFSDGIFELNRVEGGMLGLEGFAKLATRIACSDCNAQKMMATIMSEVRSVSVSGAFEDDVSLIGFRFK